MSITAHPISSTERRAPSRLRVPAANVLRLLAVTVILLPLYAFLATDSGLAARLAVLGMLAVTLVRPADGLLLCAGLLPLGFPLRVLLHAQVSMREPLLLAFLAGWLLRDAVLPRSRDDSGARGIATPALLLVAVVVASMLVQLSVEQASVDYPWPFARQVIAHLASDYLNSNHYAGIGPGATMLEGLGLFFAAMMLCRRARELGPSTLAMVAVGGLGVAALNVSRVLSGSLRGAPLLDLVHAFRIAWVFPDVNAAGSYFAMVLFTVVGLAIVSRRARPAWAVVGLVVVVGLVLTGSRSAWLSMCAAPVLGVAWVRAARGQRGSRAVVAAVLGAAVIGAVLIWWLSVSAAADRTILVSLQWRGRLNLAAAKAFAAHPFFGVGIGQYWAESPNYLDPVARAAFQHENAHDNFLQILAELGIVGFVPFMWILGTVARRAQRIREPVTVMASLGVLAFMLTCLTGHPLLIFEVSDAFWLVLGVVAALSLPLAVRSAVPGPSTVRARRWLPAAIILCVAASVPLRAHRILETDTNLANAAIGFLPGWATDEAGVSFRKTGGRADFYVGERACKVTFDVRIDPADPRTAADVDLRVDGRPVDRVRALRDAWREVRVTLVPDARKRFRKIGLRALPTGDVMLRTGRPSVTDCVSPAAPAGAAPRGRPASPLK